MSDSSAGLVALSTQPVVAKRKIFSFLGSEFRLETPSGQELFFAKQRAFKLKEDIRVFSDSKRTHPIIHIKARNWMDFSAAYDIYDANSGEHIGAAQRRGMSSTFVKDHWLVLDTEDNLVGEVVEQGGLLAVLRKFISLLQIIPQQFRFTDQQGGEGSVRQRFNILQLKHDCQMSVLKLDSRHILGVIVLLLAIEGRQN